MSHLSEKSGSPHASTGVRCTVVYSSAGPPKGRATVGATGSMSSDARPLAEDSQPSRWTIWWRLARPFSLTASTVPVLVGSAVALATGNFRAPDLFIAMLVASVL